MERKNKKIIAYGYVKKEEGVYTAICINMGLFGQGKTPEEALKKVIKAVVSYVSYILEKHPDECEKYLRRPAPANLVEEFAQLIKVQKKLTKSKQCQPRQFDNFSPFRTFAETVSFAQA
jgi:hypothetical protein